MSSGSPTRQGHRGRGRARHPEYEAQTLLLEEFPTALAARTVTNTWHAAAVRVYRN